MLLPHELEKQLDNHTVASQEAKVSYNQRSLEFPRVFFIYLFKIGTDHETGTTNDFSRWLTDSF